MADLGTQIQVAKSAGYSDADIAAHLATDPTLGAKISQAKAAGYGDADIVSHLAGPPKDANAFAKAGRIMADEFHKASDAYKADVHTLTTKAAPDIGVMDVARPVLDAASAALSPVKGLADAAFGDKPVHLPPKVLGVDVPQWAQNINSKGLTGGDIASGLLPLGADVAAARSVAQTAKAAGVGVRTMENTLAAKPPISVARPNPAANALAPNRTAAPSLDQLQAAKSAAYGAVDQAGVQYKPEAVQTMLGDIRAKMEAANLNPLVHPKAAAVIQKLQDAADAGKAPTLTELDQMRQYVKRDLMGARAEDGERFMGRQIVDGIDGFVNGAKPGDLIAGDPQQAAALLSKARAANTVYKKFESITEAVGKAKYQAAKTGSGGNIDNVTRQAIDKQIQKIPNLTDDERSAMQQIVLGSRGQDVLRLVGKLSPGGNGLMAALELGGASAAGFAGGAHGLAAGTAVPAIGMAAKYASDAITAGKVDSLLRLVASGGDKAAVSAALAEPQTGLWAVRVAKASQKGGPALSTAVGRLGAAAKLNPTLAPLYHESQRLLSTAPMQAAASPTSQEQTTPQ